jgi:hypothetical protein
VKLFEIMSLLLRDYRSVIIYNVSAHIEIILDFRSQEVEKFNYTALG